MIPFRGESIRAGVDPAEDSFRLVALRGAAVVAAIEVPIVSGKISRADAARRAFAAAERQGVVGVRSCVAIAPTRALTTAVLELPPRSSGAPIEALAAAEMMRGGDGAGLEVALFPIREQENGPVEYFVAGARRDETTALMDDLAGCGIEVTSVDAPVCALGRACEAKNCMIVSVGMMGLDFHVIHAGQPILSRTTSLANGPATGDVLVAEIDRCAGYLSTYRAESAIDEIVLVGRESIAQGVVGTVKDEFDVNVRVWHAAVPSSAIHGLGPEFTGAFGAAMWQRAGRAAA